MNDTARQATWLDHRLTRIVYAEALTAAQAALRCGACDAGLSLREWREQPLGVPPVKWALGVEFQGPLDAAAGIVQTLTLHLKDLPVILVRQETLGSANPDIEPARIAARPVTRSERSSGPQGPAAESHFASINP